MLHIWDSRRRALIPFTPLKKGVVNFYSCGPTVYNEVHIGNIRSFLFADTLRRWLQYGENYEVQWVMNITDVDDKTIRDSQKRFPEMPPMDALLQFTGLYTDLFFETLGKLNIQKSDFYSNPKATDAVSAMQDLVQKIYNNGFAYIKDGSVYFDVQKYSKLYKYGHLADVHFDEQQKTGRIEADEYEKENAADFVLWKGKKEGEPFWNYELKIKNEELLQDEQRVKNKKQKEKILSLPGRPGWHLECSAMEKEAFGLPFDIHSGGVDLCFPHHEDEIAQSTAGYGIDPNPYWVHNEHLFVEGQKMSKSLGNFFTLSDLQGKGFSPEVIRFFLVTNHYRTKLNLSFEALEGAKKTLQRIRNAVRGIATLPIPSQNEETSAAQDFENTFKKEFSAAMEDDLNVAVAMAKTHEYLSSLSQNSSLLTSSTHKTLHWLESLFGVSLFPQDQVVPDEVLLWVKQRDEARVQKNWAESDRLRALIHEQGFEVRDTPSGGELLPLAV
ncbi:MAG: cysteine--tRNA ligase [Candidatus Peregrinibacteria bacterium]